MSEAMTLADRYRRLLAWYPKDHRERHGEEMLDVLLAGAGDRERPSRKETVDVLRGALRLHLRRMIGADGGINHRDVLSIVSLLGPIVMLAGAVVVVDKLHRMLLGRHPTTDPRQLLGLAPEGPVYAMWFVVAVLSLFRLRKTAAVGAWLSVFAFMPAASINVRYYWHSMAAYAGWLLLGLLIAAALTWSPGPARGWELVSRKRVVVLAAAVVASVLLVMKSFGEYDVVFVQRDILIWLHGAGQMTLWFLALAVLIAGTLVAGGARTREGRRAALMLSVPVMVSLLTFVLPTTYDAAPAVVAVCYAVPLVVLVMFGGLPRRARVRA